MARTYELTAITLKSHSLGEFDQIITFFSREQGLVRAVAKGIKKASSRWSGRLDTLFCNRLTLSKGRNLDVVTQADTLYAFPRLRGDLNRLAHGLYVLELILVFTTEEDPHSEELFELLMPTLQALEDYSPVPLLVLWFELRLLHQLGYRPRLEACLYCSRPLQRNRPGLWSFDTVGGGYVCPGCSGQARRIAKVPPACFDLWLQLQRCSLGDIARVEPAEKPLAIAQNVLRSYIAHTAEQGLKTLRTLKALTQ